MFVIKKICFESEDVSVEVTGDYTPAEDSMEGGLAFQAIDGSYTLIYEIERTPLGTKEALLDMQMDMYEKTWKIGEIKLNGLKGHYSAYGRGKQKYYKSRFLLDETEEGCTQFIFTVYTKNDLKKFKASDDFKRILNGIRKKGS